MKAETCRRAALLLEARDEAERLHDKVTGSDSKYDAMIVHADVRERATGTGREFGEDIVLPRDFGAKWLQAMIAEIDEELLRLGVQS